MSKIYEKLQVAKLINSVGFEKNNFTPCIDESFSILLLLKHIKGIFIGLKLMMTPIINHLQ